MKNKEIFSMLEDAINNLKEEEKRLPYVLLTLKNERFLQSLLAFKLYEKLHSKYLIAPEWRRYDIAMLEPEKNIPPVALIELKIVNCLDTLQSHKKKIQKDLDSLRNESKGTACYFVLFSLWCEKCERNDEAEGLLKKLEENNVIKYKVVSKCNENNKNALCKKANEFLEKEPIKIGPFLNQEISLLAWIIEI